MPGGPPTIIYATRKLTGCDTSGFSAAEPRFQSNCYRLPTVSPTRVDSRSSGSRTEELLRTAKASGINVLTNNARHYCKKRIDAF